MFDEEKEKRMDLSLNRSTTINTGNYSSMKQDVSLTKHDILSSDLWEEYEKMSNIMDALMGLEIMAQAEEMNDINDVGIRKYLDAITEHKDEMIGIIKRGGNIE